MQLTREMILTTPDLSTTITSLEIPEWFGSISLRVMTGKEREKFENAIQAKNSDGSLRALLASLCVCEEDGKRLFNEADLKSLGDKSSKALDRIYQAALKLNALGKDGVEELEKNSDAAT